MILRQKSSIELVGYLHFGVLLSDSFLRLSYLDYSGCKAKKPCCGRVMLV